MNRRRFLKYAGATAAVVGTSALGLDRLLSSQPKQIGTSWLTSSSVNSSTLISESTTATSLTSTSPSRSVEISFYYDPHLTGKLNPSNSQPQGLSINGQLTNKITAHSNTTMPLNITGTSPVGKQLSTATYDEPRKPVSLQNFQYSIGLSDVAIGLADGPATSPIKPSQLNLDDFDSLVGNFEYFAKYYPPGWSYTPNYFMYGSTIRVGSLVGQPHFAFDIRCRARTPVHAPWGGEIIPGLYDWKFGIANEFGVLYLNHLVATAVISDHVSRYDLVGTSDSTNGHVHLEYRDLGFNGEYSDFEHSHPQKILELFTIMKPEDLLKNPLLGEPVPILPYFGP